MSAWEGSAFQEASERERERHAHEMKSAVENAPRALRKALANVAEEFTGTFPTRARSVIEQEARHLGFSVSKRWFIDIDWEAVTFTKNAKPVCRFCGKTREEHGDPYPGRPVPRMPCLGLKSGFVNAALDSVPYDPLVPGELPEMEKDGPK